MSAKRSSAWLVLLLAACACRPVVAIGWGELLILLAIIAALMGPLLLRIYRTLEALRKSQGKPGNSKKAR